MISLKRRLRRAVVVAFSAALVVALGWLGGKANAQAEFDCEPVPEDTRILQCEGFLEEPVSYAPGEFADYDEIRWRDVNLSIGSEEERLQSVTALLLKPEAPHKRFIFTSDGPEPLTFLDVFNVEEAVGVRTDGSDLTLQFIGELNMYETGKGIGMQVQGSVQDIQISRGGNIRVVGADEAVGIQVEGSDTVLAVSGRVNSAVVEDHGTAVGIQVRGSRQHIRIDDDGDVWTFGADEAVGMQVESSDTTLHVGGNVFSATDKERGTATGVIASGDALTVDIQGQVDAWTAPGGSAVGMNVSGRDMDVRIGDEETELFDDFTPRINARVDDGAFDFSGESRAVALKAAGTGRIDNYGQVEAGRWEDLNWPETIGPFIGASAVAEGGRLTFSNRGVIRSANHDTSVGVRLGAVDGKDGTQAEVVLVNDGSIFALSDSESLPPVDVLIGVGNADVEMGDIVIVNEYNDEGGIGAIADIPETPGDDPIPGDPEDPAVDPVPSSVAIAMEYPEQAYRSFTLINRGRVYGDIVLGNGKNVVELHASGHVAGSIRLGQGDGFVSVRPGAAWDGVLDGEGGTNRLVLLGGESDKDDDVVGRVGEFDNFDFIEVRSGHWIVPATGAGTMAGAATMIREGATLGLGDGTALRLISESASVGTLAGSGTFAGDLYNESGLVTPGESIGRLTIDGDYAHDSDAVLDIEVDPGKPEGDPNGSDLLYVTGKATIDGGEVRVTLTGPASSVSGRKDFTILKAEGGVEGAFDRLDVRGDISPFLKFSLSHMGPDAVDGTDEVVFSIIRQASFSSVARTPNQKSVAGALDDMIDGTPSHDVDSVLGELQMSDEDAVRDALDRMSGEIYTWHRLLDRQKTDGVVRAVRSGRIVVTDDKDPLWFAQDADVIVLAGDKEYAGGQARTFSFTTGYTLLQRPGGSRLAVLGNLFSADGHMPGRGSVLTGSGYTMGLYGRFSGSWVRVDGLATYGNTAYHVTRDIVAGSETRRAEGAFDTNVVAAAVDAGLRPFDTPVGRAEITAGLTWMSSARSQVKETGAGSLDLIVHGGEADALQGRVGVRLTPRPTKTLMGMDAYPWLHVGWVQEFRSLPTTVTAKMHSLPDHPMEIGGVDAPQGRVRFRAGVTLAWAGNDDVAIGVQYTGEFGSGLTEHGLTVQAGIRF